MFHRPGPSRPRVRSPLRVVPLLLALALAGLAGCTGSGKHAPSADASTRSAGVGRSLSGPAYGRIPDIVDIVNPSVVTVRTQKGLGSGVIYKPNGVIVTNRHVVAREESQQAPVFPQVTIVFATGKKAEGQVIDADYRTDLAVVKVDKKGLRPAKFQTKPPGVGELAVAIGSPLGFSESVTAGIISGLNRSFPASQTKRPLVNLIQTDAPISPGNSGGALVNKDAKVVGIAELYIPPESGAESIGFAIPSATVVDVVNQILKTGHVEHAILGVSVVRVTPALARQLGLQQARGALVRKVFQRTGAAQAGIKPGDVVIAVAGQRIRQINKLYAVLRKHQPGDTVKVKIVRHGQTKTLRVMLTSRS